MSKPLFITDVLQQLKAAYVELVDDATEFFEHFDEVQAVYIRENKKLTEAKQQLKTILNYKAKNGTYPKIKDQDDAAVYVEELNQIKAKAEALLTELSPKVLKGFEKRRKMLDKMATVIIDYTIKDKDAGKFLTTIVLRAPHGQDRSRCPNNEKHRPLYTAALAIQLVAKLAQHNLIDDKYIQLHLPNWQELDELVNPLEDVPEAIENYKKRVLFPIVYACLIQNLGSYSPAAEALYEGKRYRPVDEETRRAQIKTIYEKSLIFFKYGVGLPQLQDFETESEFEQERQRAQMVEDILVNYNNPAHLLGNLIRVPMIYTSFILSTKQKYEYQTIFKAFDVLTSAIKKNIVKKEVADTLKAMVGRFPLGTGIYFISKETKMPERGVVIALDPTSPNNAIVKQLTKRQVQFDDSTQVEVTPEYNLLFEPARKASDFGPAYFKKQFPDGFYWNPADLWERDIDHVKFWRRDNNVKQN